MKKYLNILFGTLSIIAIIFFFVPTFETETAAISAFSLIFSKDFSPLYLFVLFPYLTLIASGIVASFGDKIKHGNTISFLLTLTSGVFFIFPNSFYEFALGLDSGTTYLTAISYVLIVVSFISSLYFNSKMMKENAFTVKDIVEVGLFVALAIVLDLSIFKIKLAAGAGSISFIMVPLFIIALRKGFVKGFISLGIIFGLVSCVFDGYGFFTYPFDYLLGFGLLAVVGLFRNIILPKDSNKFSVKGLIFLILATLLGCLLRTLSSTISGMIFYELDFVSSFIYQFNYMGFSSLIAVVTLSLLYKPLLIVNKLFPNRD
jgi:thiamine transporter